MTQPSDSAPTPAPTVISTDAFNDRVRGAVIVIGLLTVAALAFIGMFVVTPIAQQIAQQCATALTLLLAGAAGYLFRGRVEKTDSSTVAPIAPTITNNSTR